MLNRGVIETTAKSVGYHWAATTAFNLLRHLIPFKPGILVTSSEIEDLLLSYSHFTRADVQPLLVALGAPIKLIEAIDKVETPPKLKLPTMAKLLGICSFLSREEGTVLRYAYGIACDLVHSGPICLALSDLVTSTDVTQKKAEDHKRELMHGLVGILVKASYPLLCLETLKSSFRVFSRYVLEVSTYDFRGRILELVQKGSPTGLVNIKTPHIRKFLDGDDPIIFVASDGNEVRVYK